MSTPPKLEVFFDVSSPWTYLAFELIQPLAKEFAIDTIWRPVLVGGIFNAVNPSVYYMRENVPAKIAHNEKDLHDWEMLTGLKIIFPPKNHPVNSAKVMRACLVLEPEGKLVDFARAAFQAYFGQDRDISSDDVIRELCASTCVDAEWLFEQITQTAVKDRLRANTDEAIARGSFGVPTMFLNDTDRYFGVDRLAMLKVGIERAIREAV